MAPRERTAALARRPQLRRRPLGGQLGRHADGFRGCCDHVAWDALTATRFALEQEAWIRKSAFDRVCPFLTKLSTICNGTVR